jgi:polar amino acid transport system substrate-binding protein
MAMQAKTKLRLVSACIVIASAASNTNLRAETIRIAIGEYPPHVSQHLPGFGPHARKVKRVLERAGHDVQYVFRPWNRALLQTANGTFAATFPWFKTPQREKRYRYPDTPLDVNRVKAFYDTEAYPDGLSIPSLEAIVRKDLRVAGVHGYWYVEHLQALGARLDLVPTAKLAWNLIDHGRADIYLEDARVARMDITAYLGADRLSDFAAAGLVKEAPMYVLFTRQAPIGAELRDAWDAHAPQPSGRSPLQLDTGSTPQPTRR